jgi:hypothetical protein
MKYIYSELLVSIFIGGNIMRQEVNHLKFDKIPFIWFGVCLAAFIISIFILKIDLRYTSGLVIIIPSLGILIRTKSYRLIPTIIFGITILVTPIFITVNKSLSTDMVISISVLYFVLALLMYYCNKKLPYNILGRYLRNIFYVAGMPVGDFRDGYTNRPYPLNFDNLSINKFRKFSDFLNYNLIATSFYKDDRIILVFSNGIFQYIPGMEPNWRKATYITVNHSGEISVHISRQDYDKYEDALTFDQLCISLGNVIMDFFNTYMNGEEAEIINYLKDSEPPRYKVSRLLRNPKEEIRNLYE